MGMRLREVWGRLLEADPRHNLAGCISSRTWPGLGGGSKYDGSGPAASPWPPNR